MTAPSLIVGFGRTGQAMAAALRRRGQPVVACDDKAGDDALRVAAAGLGVELHEAPVAAALELLVQGAAELLPAPGLPDHHPAFELAARHGVPVRSELDLAGRWDGRPVVAVTGTDGKTTVTTLATGMLVASGVQAVAVGNNELPLVTAIDDPGTEVFVVEASSFRLLHSERFAPLVGAWLNFAPDHLDSHRSLEAYQAAKARIWRDQSPDQVAVGNADDPVVLAHLRSAVGRQQTFGMGGGADWRPEAGWLSGPGAPRFVAVDDLPRRFAHDVANALAAAAVALPAGATPEGCASTLRAFRGLPHRVELVADEGGVRWFDSSKATTPHSALNDVSVVGSAVLIAGGRNKGLDLRVLARAAPSLRGVVAIGEAAPDVAAAFVGLRPVTTASSMTDAIAAAAAYAEPGDAVVLAPGCASFDWYSSYGERGDDFARGVRSQLGLDQEVST
ncbi:MAG: UDP-N-acetylmuramoyl-L-alanine--D-glutamate ligase [Acidimicrobiales bacterium]